MHQKFDQLIDDYFPDLKDEKEEKIERCPKTGDYVFKKINRDKEDYVRIYESDGPPIFTDLVENESKIGTVHITNPLPKIERKNELKKDYLEWLKMERLMKPNERREEYELMQNKYLEVLILYIMKTLCYIKISMKKLKIKKNIKIKYLKNEGKRFKNKITEMVIY
ncbi:uncharacterized protein LOC113221570 isoform X3 [Piliocolobus tephrosceles]|uniref:uncharacterized protein LOC113221570 isoform X3 n=1 Tax=Piliocolobus tephrosceles TaxID=591936 RepID=UPI000E6B0534|nr:uncharacterized protein LOC113221570 isoform X3 [Piliocolobus tephrosceles]